VTLPIGPVAGICAGAYLIGAIPFGYLVARAKGVNIRAHGSGNIGATNVGRVLGRGWGVLVLALDAGKCFAVMLLARQAAARLGASHPDPAAMWLLFGAGASAVVGSIAPIYLGFRGGKAVAASVGMLLGVWPDLAIPALGCLAIWIGVVAATRYVSAGSLIAAAAHPLFVMAYLRANDRSLAPSLPLLLLSGFVVAVIWVRHRANLGRLLSGTEKKIGGRGEP